MSAFNEVKLGFDGKDYVIPADRVMGAIARVEGVLTMGEVAAMARSPKSDLKLSRLASAYGELLRYAGADVSDDAVYVGMFGDGGAVAVTVALTELLALMMPPDAMKKALEGKPPGEGNRQARRAASSLSRKRSKPRAPRKQAADGG
jgi:hypothetical protein